MNGVALLPSLDRAQLVKEFFQSYRETEASVPVWVIIDRLDPKKEEYYALDLPKDSKIITTENARSMGDKFRAVFDDVKDLDFVIILNDDHRPRTKGWDETIKSQLNGRNVVFTNDGASPDKPWNFPNRICGAIAISGQILKTLGWIFPPDLQHFYSDDVWGDLFGKAQCVQGIGDVCVEHYHAYLHPELRDETYKRINGEAGDNQFHVQKPTGGFWEGDREAYVKWRETNAEKDIQKIIDLQPKTGVMIATPFHDNSCALVYTLGLVDTCMALRENNIYFEMARVVGSSLITHARNSLVDMFLKSKCQKLLFIDSDQGFDRNSAFKLFSSSRRIIAGITPHKRFPINLNFEPLEEDKHYFKDLNNKGLEEFMIFAKEKADENGDIRVARAGTGFMAIDRSVFEIIKPFVKDYHAFDQRTDVSHGEYFIMGAHDGRYRGEDWRFSMLAQEQNIPIYINAAAMIPHQGSFLFSVQ